jgi:hypothetical protein
MPNSMVLEAHALQHLPQRLGPPRGVFDDLDAVRRVLGRPIPIKLASSPYGTGASSYENCSKSASDLGACFVADMPRQELTHDAVEFAGVVPVDAMAAVGNLGELCMPEQAGQPGRGGAMHIERPVAMQ